MAGIVAIDRTTKPRIVRGAGGTRVNLTPASTSRIGPVGPPGGDADFAGFVDAPASATSIALAGKYVPLTRTLSPGSGLTGGGNLTADRTLSFVETTVAVPRGTNVNIAGLGPQAYLRGRMATLTIELSVAATVTAGTALLTLPVGYRPVTRIYFNGSGSRLFYISTDGTVKNTADTLASAVDGSVTYPVA